MPGCVLRVFGPTKKVRSFLANTALKPCATFIKGEPVTPTSSRIVKRSGFNILVSRADGNLPSQTRDAIRFLRRHSKEFTAMTRLFGPGHAQLDFGLWDISSEQRPWPTFLLPHGLISEAGRYGLEVELSFYGPPGEE